MKTKKPPIIDFYQAGLTAALIRGRQSLMERRQHKRVNALLAAEEQVLIENGTELVSSTLVNLSKSGALLELKESGIKFPFGQTVHLFLDNGGQLLELNTIAVRVDGQKIAFRFDDLSVEQQRAIDTKMIRMAIISARVHGAGTSTSTRDLQPAHYVRISTEHD
jgi:c-di-GMP-binding flagellar brake protein YcgR